MLHVYSPANLIIKSFRYGFYGAALKIYFKANLYFINYRFTSVGQFGLAKREAGELHTTFSLTPLTFRQLPKMDVDSFGVCNCHPISQFNTESTEFALSASRAPRQVSQWWESESKGENYRKTENIVSKRERERERGGCRITEIERYFLKAGRGKDSCANRAICPDATHLKLVLNCLCDKF